MMPQNKNALFSILYFILSTILTAVFITNKFWLYSSADAMILSGTIAGAKWLLQIIAAFVLLKELKWIFIRRISFICFIGSGILWVYYLFNFLPLPIESFTKFIFSIGLSVLVMIVMYYHAVKKTRLSFTWFLGWILCLTVAILLQVYVVF